MKRFIAAAVAVTAVLGLAPVADARPAPHSKLAVCQFEDGSGAHQRFPCVWDATVRGNRKGTSYVLSAPWETAKTRWDLEYEAISLDMFDAADELAAAIRAVPAKQRTAAMKAALAHFEQNER